MNKMWTIVAVIVGACFVAANSITNNKTRIINGHDVELGKYPFMVALRQYGRHLCGGTIINDKYVLTAGHCLYGEVASTIQVHAATNKHSEPGDIYNAEKIMPHEDYVWPVVNYDIGLVKVDRNFDFTNPLIQKVLLDPNYINGNRLVTAIGFGYTEEPQKDILQELDMVTLKHEDCNNKVPILTQELCVYASETQGVCSGDSGGPIVHKFTNVQVGITERGVVPECTHGHPDIFTRLDSFITWINDNSKY